MDRDFASVVAESRSRLVRGLRIEKRKAEAEGGCGVLGIASSVQIEGRHLMPALGQMRNRGNGKGGGVALVGLSPTQLGVSKRILEEDYMLQVAYLDSGSKSSVEDECIHPFFDVHDDCQVHTEHNFRSLDLDIEPPSVHRYFVRSNEKVFGEFLKTNGLSDFDTERVEDEFVYQRTFDLNKRYYSSGTQRAFVLSSGKNMAVFKLVGYAEDVIEFYGLNDVKAHVWIGHHRYPTKGKVWHPGGAHPFVGLHHALVHNGDFSNYSATANYLAERNMYPLFSTDTEVGALLFDLWNRQYGYSDEVLLEAMAPTTERDYHLLPLEKRRLYKNIQASHIRASPDGPWFFIVAGHDPYRRSYELFGITDTSMLRPQVFAVQDGSVQIGVIASERQVINALLLELAEEGRIPCSLADKYWNARGGSHTDGGAYIFSIDYTNGSGMKFRDKFGIEVIPPDGTHFERSKDYLVDREAVSKFKQITDVLTQKPGRSSSVALFNYLSKRINYLSYGTILELLEELEGTASDSDAMRSYAIQTLTRLHDLMYDTGDKKRSSVIELICRSLNNVLSSVPRIGENGSHSKFSSIDFGSRKGLVGPKLEDQVLVVDSLDFPQEGEDGLSRMLVRAYEKGWRRFMPFNLRGHRFLACGFGSNSRGVRIDAYGDIGDYAGSGIDGLELHVHGAGQDQAMQIAKNGKAVFYGDVGQTFMYGSKGGEVFVMGNAAGRPMINAVGQPKVVINGTCLDYLAESFMAGDPLNGGGYVIVNGIEFDARGDLIEQRYPYPGGNLLSLAAGGAVYVRDPRHLVEENQLHGGEIRTIENDDWEIMKSMLLENERLFGISINDLLVVDGRVREPEDVYRKVAPRKRH